MRKRSLLVVILLALLIASAPNAYAYDPDDPNHGGGGGKIDSVQYNSGDGGVSFLDVDTSSEDEKADEDLTVASKDNEETKADEEKKDEKPAEEKKAENEVYTVVSGDWLYKICAKYGCTLDELLAVNPQIQNPNRIYVGDKITIPSKPAQNDDEKGENGENGEVKPASAEPTQQSGEGTEVDKVEEEKDLSIETKILTGQVAADKAEAIVKQLPNYIIKRQMKDNTASGAAIDGDIEIKKGGIFTTSYIKYTDGSSLRVTVYQSGKVYYTVMSAEGEKAVGSMAYKDKIYRASKQPDSIGYSEEYIKKLQEKQEKEEKEKETDKSDPTVAEATTVNSIYNAFLKEEGMPDMKNVNRLSYENALRNVDDILSDGGILSGLANLGKAYLRFNLDINLADYQRQLYADLQKFSARVNLADKTQSQALSAFWEWTANDVGGRVARDKKSVSKEWDTINEKLEAAYQKAYAAKQQMNSSSSKKNLEEAQKAVDEAKKKMNNARETWTSNADQEAYKEYKRLQDEVKDLEKKVTECKDADKDKQELIDKWNKVQEVFKYRSKL